MSSRHSRIVILSFVLAFTLSSTPTSAAVPDRDPGRDRDVPSIIKVIKKAQKLVIRALADTMSTPKP
jgi:hypothetical protein